jgi:hypothetical protein
VSARARSAAAVTKIVSTVDQAQLRERAHEARERLARRDAFLPAQLTVLAAILLYVMLPEKLTVGPSWLLPGVEGLLLVGLVVATPHPSVRYSSRRRTLALALIGLVELPRQVVSG